MILPVATLMVAVLVLAAGRDLSGLLALRLRALRLLAASLGLQLGLTLGTVPAAIGEPLHLLSYALAATVVVMNRHVPGLWLIGLGGGLNLLAIAANGGTMPASPAALARAGMEPTTGSFVNSGPVDGARLAWFGDVFAVPAALPLANVFSIGDVLLVLGVAVLLVGTSDVSARDAQLVNPGRA